MASVCVKIGRICCAMIPLGGVLLLNDLEDTVKGNKEQGHHQCCPSDPNLPKHLRLLWSLVLATVHTH